MAHVFFAPTAQNPFRVLEAVFVHSHHGALTGLKNDVRGETVFPGPAVDIFQLLVGGGGGLAQFVHDGVDGLVIFESRFLGLFWGGYSLLCPTHGYFLHIAEVLFAPVYAVLDQIVDQVIGKAQHIG